MRTKQPFTLTCIGDRSADEDAIYSFTKIYRFNVNCARTREIG